MALTPNLPDVLLATADAALDSVHTSKPGRIKSYDRAKQVADVEICVKSVFDDEQGQRIVETYPVIPNVPVIFPGGGGFRTTYPVAAGDTCLLIFADCSTDAWQHLGGVVDPGMTERRHSINDAVALVGLRDLKHSLKGVDGTGAPGSAMSIGKDTGPTIEIDDSTVKIGGATGTDQTLMATAFMNALDTLIDAIKAGLIAAGNTTVGGTAIGVTFQTAATAFDAAASGFKTTIARLK